MAKITECYSYYRRKLCSLGGTGIISTVIEKQLKSMGIIVNGFAGNDGYDTSVKIAEQIDTSNDVVNLLKNKNIAKLTILEGVRLSAKT